MEGGSGTERKKKHTGITERESRNHQGFGLGRLRWKIWANGREDAVLLCQLSWVEFWDMCCGGVAGASCFLLQSVGCSWHLGLLINGLPCLSKGSFVSIYIYIYIYIFFFFNLSNNL